jgi:hypothetical protein
VSLTKFDFERCDLSPRVYGRRVLRQIVQAFTEMTRYGTLGTWLKWDVGNY